MVHEANERAEVHDVRILAAAVADRPHTFVEVHRKLAVVSDTVAMMRAEVAAHQARVDLLNRTITIHSINAGSTFEKVIRYIIYIFVSITLLCCCCCCYKRKAIYAATRKMGGTVIAAGKIAAAAETGGASLAL